MALRFTEEELSEYLKRFGKAKSKDSAPVSVANSESIGRNAAQAKAKAKEVHPRFRLEVHHRSRRDSDPTGRSHKAAVDGAVRGGLLGDDSRSWISEIRETYKKAPYDETVIEVWEIV